MQDPQSFRTPLLALTLLGSAVLPHVAQAQTLTISYASNANLQFNPGNSPWSEDIYNFLGLSGNLTLTTGVTQTVSIVSGTQSLGLDFSNTTASKTLSHDVAINGVTHSFSQSVTVNDIVTPTFDITSGGTQVFHFSQGTVGVTLNSLETGTFNRNSTATLLYTASAVTPELPGTMQLLPALLPVALVGARKRFKKA
ncbi:hypothetical protein [Armatimonas rosea]|uniref:Choice-of-anchor E domain-containing protein n=1 Tax=Armatimonas rosea TaxID=685828 RepID=A0A7W9SRS6_ARMRO|nr:hypothetical protein [Armatimonas rosea]MBB6051516.1 hypothetical protein [Armatimonas rosea]